MKKLKNSFLQKCNQANCCFDDFLILPPDVDVGVEEYIDYKVEQIISAKHIYSAPEEHKLMLSYPHPNCDNSFFELFFESPSVVANNHQFCGCFAIDVTDYLGQTNNFHFQQLMSYISQHTDIVFVLFVYSDKKSMINEMFNLICQYDSFRKISIPLPDADTLAGYTLDGIRKSVPKTELTIFSFLSNYFKEKEYGYDTAELITLFMINENFDGTLSSFEKLIQKYEKSKTVNGSTKSFHKIGF